MFANDERIVARIGNCIAPITSLCRYSHSDSVAEFLAMGDCRKHLRQGC